MSASGDSGAGALPTEWTRLEHAVEDAVAAIANWRARALDAEREASMLRSALENSFLSGDAATLTSPERLQAENAVLRSRMDEARRRMQALQERLRVLEARH